MCKMCHSRFFIRMKLLVKRDTRDHRHFLSFDGDDDDDVQCRNFFGFHFREMRPDFKIINKVETFHAKY